MLVHPVGLNGEAHSLAPAVPAAPTDQHGAGRREVAASARPGPGIRSAGPEAAGAAGTGMRMAAPARAPPRRGAIGGAVRGGRRRGTRAGPWRRRGGTGGARSAVDMYGCMHLCMYVCIYLSIYV